MTEAQDEEAFLDAMDVREAMLDAAVGRMAVLNVPSARVRLLMAWTSDPTVRFACQILLYQRGEDWQ